MRIKLFLSILLIPIAAAVAEAQGTTSRVTGTVTDSSGGRLPGATVTLTNESTGVAFTTVTTETGNYSFDAVQVGRYTVSVELDGFKRYVSTGNTVNIGDPATINPVLEPGGVTETVEVRAAGEPVQTSTSGNLGTTYDQRTIEGLPILGGRGRNPMDLVLTQPGVVSGANTGGGVHVHGARDRSWTFTLDGIDTNETSAGGANFSPLRMNPDALAEFKVLTGNTTAEYGRNSGGQVAMVTRGGGNTFAGTLFYFDRRPNYNANEWENNIDSLPKREFTQQMPGFSLGGPIRRNKTFFFVNTQWLRANQTRSTTRTVYTADARNGIFRYSTVGRNAAAGTPAASVDANGNPIVPIVTYNVAANDPQRLGLDPTITALIGKTPLPNNFTVGDGLNTAGFTFVAPEQERQMDFTTKIDHSFNVAQSAFVRFSKGYQNTLCDQVNGGEPPFPGLPCLVNTNRSPYNWAANHRWSPSSSVVNELVIGQNHFTFDFLNPIADPSRPTLNGPITNPEDYTIGNLRTVDTFQIVDNFSWARGAHTMRFGTNMRFQRHTDTRGSVGGPGFNVAPQVSFGTTQPVDPATFGLPAAMNIAFDRPALQSHINYLLGRVGAISQAFVQAGDAYGPGGTTFDFVANYPELDFYVQDTWKPRSNLTLDIGLRYEVKLSPRNPAGLIRRPNQRVAVGEPDSMTLNWVEGKLWDDDWNNLAPSIGFAWQPNDDGRSVVRGNYRLAVDRLNTFVISSSIFQTIPGITTTIVDTAFGQSGGRLRDGLPSLQPTVSPANFLQPAVSGASMTVVDPELQTPMTHGWAITYQRAMFRNTLFEVAYVGRRAEHLFGAYNVNQVRFRDNGFLEAFNIVKAGGESALMNQLLAPDTRRLTGESGSAMLRRLAASASQLTLDSVAALAASLGTRLQGGRTLPELAGLGSHFFFPYPQFLGGVNVIDSEDYSRYHALELKLERRFADGYSYLMGYTLSRSKDTRSYDPAFTVVSGANNQSASSTPFDIFNRDLNYALSDFDRTHVFQAQGVWELPLGDHPVARGWTLAGQMVAQSGRPFTVYSGSNTMSNIVQTPANCDGCSPSFGSIHDEGGLIWYLTPEERARFSAVGPGEMGNTGRNAFRGPGSWYVNSSLAKRTYITRTQILEVRADATNVFNTPTWGFPTATITSTIFGRNRTPIGGNSRKVMLGIKYYF